MGLLCASSICVALQATTISVLAKVLPVQSDPRILSKLYVGQVGGCIFENPERRFLTPAARQADRAGLGRAGSLLHLRGGAPAKAATADAKPLSFLPSAVFAVVNLRTVAVVAVLGAPPAPDPPPLCPTAPVSPPFAVQRRRRSRNNLLFAGARCLSLSVRMPPLHALVASFASPLPESRTSFRLQRRPGPES